MKRELRSKTKAQTKTSKINKIKRDYKKGKPKRQRKQVVPFAICHKKNLYYHSWSPSEVETKLAIMEYRLANAQDVKAIVEELGEVGAKWYLTTSLKKIIEDGDGTYKSGHFHTFSGAHCFDIVYVDAATGDVYVLEAKGTKKGSSANLISRNNGKTQGQWNYLDEVAAEMANSGNALKIAVADKIINAPTGKLHYIGVHTKYDVSGTGKVTGVLPAEIFNKSR